MEGEELLCGERVPCDEAYQCLMGESCDLENLALGFSFLRAGCDIESVAFHQGGRVLQRHFVGERGAGPAVS